MHILGMLIVTAVILFLTSWSDNFDKGYNAAHQGQVDGAIYHYTLALEGGDMSRQNQARALNNRAIAYYQKGLYTRALRDLDLAIQLTPMDLSITRNRQAAAMMANGSISQPTVLSAASGEQVIGLRTQQRIKLFGLL